MSMPALFCNAEQHVVRQARRGRPVQLARLRARRLHQLRKRIHLQQGRRRHAEKVIDHWCDRHQVGGRIVRQALVQQGIERDHAGEGEQEGVVVACAEERTVTAGMPSAPWRFSTTTGWPQRSVNRSARRRPARSIPLPGGSGTTKRTVFCGQVGKDVWGDGCACAAPAKSAGASISAAVVARDHRAIGRRAFMFSNSLEADGDAPDGIDFERDGVLVRLDRQRRHHRAGDDDLARTQTLAESRQQIGDVADDVDPFTGIRPADRSCAQTRYRGE